MLLSKIPGYTKAVARAAQREEALRRTAFLPHVAVICGIPVRPFTPRHFLILDEADSPFIGGRTARPEHVAQFLWIASPEFLLPSPQVTLREVLAARAAFVRRIARIAYARALREIDAHIDAALLDRPPSSDSTDRPVASFAAVLVDDIASAYGWPDEVLDARGQPIFGAGILDKPLARLCQYRRMIWLRRDPEMTLINRLSDAAGHAVIARYTARRTPEGRAPARPKHPRIARRNPGDPDVPEPVPPARHRKGGKP